MATYLQDFLAKMAAVEQEMGRLRGYLNEFEEMMDLSENWPRYGRYAPLEAAANAMDLATHDLKALSKKTVFRSGQVERFLANARTISLETSNAASFAIQVIDRKTSSYVEVHDGVTYLTRDLAQNVLAEMAKLLDRSTEVPTPLLLSLPVILILLLLGHHQRLGSCRPPRASPPLGHQVGYCHCCHFHCHNCHCQYCHVHC